MTDYNDEIDYATADDEVRTKMNMLMSIIHLDDFESVVRYGSAPMGRLDKVANKVLHSSDKNGSEMKLLSEVQDQSAGLFKGVVDLSLEQAKSIKQVFGASKKHKTGLCQSCWGYKSNYR